MDSFVEVFRTTVPGRRAAGRVLRHLQAHWPAARITFDLADRDRILRIQTAGSAVRPERVAAVVAANGYLCAPLPDDDAAPGVSLVPPSHFAPAFPAFPGTSGTPDTSLCSPSNNSAI